MAGIIICHRQLLQSYGQLLYPSTVLVECWAESLLDTGPTNGAGMCIYYTYHSRYGVGGGGGIIICRRQLLQSYCQLLYPSTVSVECWAESLQDTGPTNGAGMYSYYHTYHSIYGG